MTQRTFDDLTYAGLIALGIVCILVARWASRRRGSRLDSFVALRVGDVLVTEVIGALLVGYGLGSLVAPDESLVGGQRGPRPVGRIGLFFGGQGATIQFGLALAFALFAILIRIDIRDVLLGGRTTRNPLTSYIGWDARVIAKIPAGGYGEIAMHDANGNIMPVSATSDVDIAEGTTVRVVGTKDLNLVVAPEPWRT